MQRGSEGNEHAAGRRLELPRGAGDGQSLDGGLDQLPHFYMGFDDLPQVCLNGWWPRSHPSISGSK